MPASYPDFVSDARQSIDRLALQAFDALTRPVAAGDAGAIKAAAYLGYRVQRFRRMLEGTLPFEAISAEHRRVGDLLRYAVDYCRRKPFRA